MLFVSGYIAWGQVGVPASSYSSMSCNPSSAFWIQTLLTMDAPTPYDNVLLPDGHHLPTENPTVASGLANASCELGQLSLNSRVEISTIQAVGSQT